MRLFILAFGLTLTVVSALLLWKRQNDVPQYIAFLSNRDGNSEVFIMKPDGSEITQLTFTETNSKTICGLGWLNSNRLYIQYGAMWANFICNSDSSELYFLDLNGNQTLAVEHGFNKPLGYITDHRTFLIFVTNNNYLIRYEVAAKSITSVEKFTDARKAHFTTQTKNKSWIVYFDVENNEYGIFRMDSSGTRKEVLRYTSFSPEYHNYESFSISPDNQIIAIWTTYNINGTWRNFLHLAGMNSNPFGSDLKLLAELPESIAPNASAKWSLDGNKIAYWDRDGYMTVVSIKTGLVQRILQIPTQDTALSEFDWSYDSAWLIFSFNEEGKDNFYKIFRVYPDGTGFEQLTFGAGDDIRPQYSPVVDFAWRGGLSLGIGLFFMIVGSFRLPRHAQKIGNYYRSVR